MKHSRVLATVVLTILVAGNTKPQSVDSLTVEDAVRQVIAQHPMVEQATHAVEASLARVEQSRSSYYPTSDIGLSYVGLGPVAELAFPGLGDFKLFRRTTTTSTSRSNKRYMTSEKPRRRWS